MSEKDKLDENKVKSDDFVVVIENGRAADDIYINFDGTDD